MKIAKQRLKEIIKEELENSQNEGRFMDTIESKITKSALKAIIAEELTKAEKARKKKLEKELDDLKHK